jgi:uncharacterized protein (TIGR03663 family)
VTSVQTAPVQPAEPVLAPVAEREPGPLDRSISLSGISLYAAAWVVVFAVAAAVRLLHLDRFALSQGEAILAFDGYNLYSGAPLDPGQTLPVTQPLLILLEAMSFFLFGASDVAARFVPVLAGLVMVGSLALLRPVVGRASVIGMAFFVAISPTVVYTSRLVDSNILIVASALLIVVATCRAGLAAVNGEPVRRWAGLGGLGTGLLLASGPASVSVLIALGIGVLVSIALDPDRVRGIEPDGIQSPSRPTTNVVVIGLQAIMTRQTSLIAFAITFVVTVVTLFTRLFSDLGALQGVVELFADWGRLVGSGAPAIPTQFFLLAVLLYELLAVIFAIVRISIRPGVETGSDPVDRRRQAHLSWPFFLGWFGGTLILFAFSSGREANDTVQVVLPLLLVAGLGLGSLAESIDWRAATHGGGLLITLAALGLAMTLFAVAILAGDGPQGGTSAGANAFQVAVVAVLVGGGMLLLAYTTIQRLRRVRHPVQVGRMVLLAVLLLVGAITVRTTAELNYFNIAGGRELIAQETPTEAVPALVDRLSILSRDFSVNRSNVSDPLGQHSLRVVLDPAVEWPFRWYFRDYTQLTIEPPTEAVSGETEVVIAAEGTPIGSGFTPQTYTYINRVPAVYSQPSIGTVLAGILNPANWSSSSQFLFFRDIDEPALPSSLIVGYGGDVSTRLFQTSEPTNLFEQSGYGSGDGQLNEPRGIALSNDGELIYVVDSLNARVEVFDTQGNFLSAWGGANTTSDLQLGLFQPSETATFGASDLDIGPNDLLYVADTWNHVISVVSPEGSVIRQIGVPGEPVDLGDDPANVSNEPGVFFGPRSVVVTGTEIYVTDTGNERIQVFGLDGSFLRAFGGFGTGPGQFIEPVGVATGADGNVYVADSGNARISVFTSEGVPVAQWPVQEWESYRYDPTTGLRPNFEPYLAVADDGLVYATSRITGSVLVFGPDGQPVDTLTEVGGVVLVAPVGLTLSSDGELYVSDIDLNTVLRAPVEELAGDGALDAPSLGGTPEADATPIGDFSPAPIVVEELPAGATPAATPDGTPEATPIG